jgi:hypothetical protein
MAENKKSFVLYADYIEIFEELDDVDAGQLAKHIFRYVNDKNPETDNPMVKVSFISIKQQLKRDLKKWEDFKEKQSENGKKGGRPLKKQKPKNPSLSEESQKSLNVTVTVNDTVTDTVNVSSIEENKIYRAFAHLKISVGEYDQLKEKYYEEDIEDILNRIQNYRNINKYTSLYLTALNWLKKDKRQRGESDTTKKFKCIYVNAFGKVEMWHTEQEITEFTSSGYNKLQSKLTA